jgi:hypothetical protein
MGRIDAIVSDETIESFKLAIVKRLGGKKGDLSKALEEAMELWVKSDVVEKLKKRILSASVTPEEFENLVDSLEKQGKNALPTLLEIHANIMISYPSQSKYVAQAIKHASGKI